MLNLMLTTLELRLKPNTNFAFFVQKFKTENTARGRFKAREQFHYIPEASRKPPESKPQLLNSGIGI